MGFLFGLFKHSSWGRTFRVQQIVKSRPNRLRAIISKFKYWVVQKIVASGLWELAFSTQVSDRLMGSCKAFKPDVIFSTCTDLSYAELTLQLVEALKVPLCFQVEDDWPGDLYTRGIARLLVRNRLNRNIRTLLTKSTLCISNGPLMTEAYLQRYGRHFEPVFLCDDLARFDHIRQRVQNTADGFTIVYSGSLQLDRWEGLIDLDTAIGLLPPEIGAVRIRVFTNYLPLVAKERLAASPRIELRPGLADKDVPAALKEADLLFLPESFHMKWRRYIRYSISSKSHLYMMAGRPALVYGPAGIGVVEYARNEKWAKVVDERCPATLAQAVTALLNDNTETQALLARAREVALERHDSPMVQKQFLHLLRRCAGGNENTHSSLTGKTTAQVNA